MGKVPAEPKWDLLVITCNATAAMPVFAEHQAACGGGRCVWWRLDPITCHHWTLQGIITMITSLFNFNIDVHKIWRRHHLLAKIPVPVERHLFILQVESCGDGLHLQNNVYSPHYRCQIQRTSLIWRLVISCSHYAVAAGIFSKQCTHTRRLWLWSASWTWVVHLNEERNI